MNKQLAQYVALVLLFAACFLALNFIYGYIIDLQSETNDCFFMFGGQFASEFLDRPAAPLSYAGRFLGQFYHYRWLGALIVSGCITCFGLLFQGMLVRLRDTAHFSTALFPCALLLFLHMSTVCLVQDTLGLCASCGLFLGYLSLRGTLARRIYALLVTPLGYLALGVFVWIFVVWVVAFEWLDSPSRSSRIFRIVYVLFSIAVPLAAWRWLFLIPLQSAMEWPLAFTPHFRSGLRLCSFTNLAMDHLLAGVFSASVLLIPFWRRISVGARISAFWQARRHKWNRVVPAVVLLALAVVLCVTRYDAPLATGVAYRQLYRNKRWDAILAEAREDRSTSLELQFMTNFALSQRGRLLDEMFNYPQAWGTRGLIFHFSSAKWDDPALSDEYQAMYNSDLFYEMGHVNLAFRHAYDSMNVSGETCGTLQRMVQCSMANGNYEMADKYLRRLERTLFHREFARRYRAIMADPEAAEREFGEIRRRMPLVDLSLREHPTRHLILLLANEDNSLAFDYLTAWLLLDKQRRSIVTIGDNVEHLKRAGYDSIPAHCQEGLLLWERQEGVSVDLRGFRYDRAITARVDSFLRELALEQGGPVGSPRLGQRYGDTYMYYCCCVGTPEEIRRLTSPRAGSGGNFRQE